MGNFVLFLLLGFSTLLPIVFWAYTFSYIDPTLANKKRFIVGIIAGMVSVIPVLYLDGILQTFSLEKLSVFHWMKQMQDITSIFYFFIAGIFLLMTILIVSFFVGGTSLQRKKLEIIGKNLFIFFGIIGIIAGLFFLLNRFFYDFPNTNLSLPDISVGIYIIHSLELVIFYYVLVAIVEEASKHFHFLNSSILKVQNLKQGVLYAIFIALGFSFVENILYLYAQFFSMGWGFEFVKLFFYRSSFALIVHVLCSSFLAYYFTKAYLKDASVLSLNFVKNLCFGVLGAVLLHAIFDISLTLGFSLIMFFYFIGGYLYVSSIFYNEGEEMG